VDALATVNRLSFDTGGSIPSAPITKQKKRNRRQGKMENIIVVESKSVQRNGLRAVNDAMRSGLDIRRPFRVHRERHGGYEVFVFSQFLQK